MSQTHNENIEVKTLACLFKDGSLYPVVEDILEKKTFGWKPFGLVYQSIKEIVDSDLYPDIETITTNLDQKSLLDGINIQSVGLKGRAALEYIKNLEVNIDQLESYAFQVLALNGNRQLLSLSEEIKQYVQNGKQPIETLSHIDLSTGKIAAFVGAQSKNTRTAKDVAQSSVEQFEDASKGKSRYIKTGLDAWDDFTNGLYPQRLYMIAGRTNEGKSALAQDIMKNIAIDNNIKVKLFSLEMSAEEINNRLVQILTGISPLAIENGKLSDAQLKSYTEAIEKIAKSPIVYDDSPELNLALLRTKIRKSQADGVKVVLIDQLEQLSIGGSGDTQPEYIKMNYITYRLKAYAREMDIPIIILHQMNRSGENQKDLEKDYDPILAQISQGGEKACDAILMIKNKNGDACFFWNKNRQGRKGKRDVVWDGAKITFSDFGKIVQNKPDFVQEVLPEINK